MIKHFSYSQLNLFTMCQKKYEARYIDKIAVPVSGELIRGDAYHKAIAHAYTNIVIYRQAPPIDEVLDVYSDTWNKRVGDNITIDEGDELYFPAVDFRGKDPDKMKDEGIGLLKIYYDTVMPKIIPQEVEVRKTAIYEGIELLSYMDLITFDGIVVDHKVSGRNYGEGEIAKDLQSSFYGLVLGRDELDYQIHQALALKKPEIKIIPIKRTKNDMDWVGRLIVAVWNQINTGIFHPSGLMGWWCSPTDCPYWGWCKMPKDF